MSLFSVCLETFTNSYLFSPDDIREFVNLSCQRAWAISDFNSLFYFTFNVSWTLSPQLAFRLYTSDFTLERRAVLRTIDQTTRDYVDRIVETSIQPNLSENANVN